MELASLDDLLARARVVAVPLRVPFRGVQVREAVLFEPAGAGVWSEWAPFVEYGSVEAARWLRSALHFSSLFESDAASPQLVEVNATIPAVDVLADPVRGASVIGELMGRYPGCSTVKVKVAEAGQSLEDDLARVRAVRQWFAEEYAAGRSGVLTDNPKIRLDANGGWSVEQAVQVVAAVAAEGAFDYVEQPCRSVGELAAVRMALMRQGIFARVAADEVVRKSDDPLVAVREVVGAQACDVVVLKVPPLGGVDRLLEIAEDVACRGVAVTVSSALDTGVGLGAGLQAAAELARHIDAGDDEGVWVPAQPAGLATGSLFVQDLAPRPIVDGCIMSGPVEPDPELLERYAATDERRDWWLARLAGAYQHLS